MIVKNQKYIIDLVGEEDLDRIVEIYNSNEYFLINHIGLKRITNEWLENEYQEMKNIKFVTCKVIDKCTKNIVAICDFKIQETVYLSLLMVDASLKSQGIGEAVYTLLEEYFIKEQAKRIRIDVVYNYPSNVVGFWKKMKFVKQEEIELEWNKLRSKAYLMDKVLQKV